MKPLDVFSVPLKGIQLIEASAGTGKTYTITTLFLRLLLERRLSVDQIVVVTFTKAATAELRERVRKRLREALQVFSEQSQASDDTLAELVRRTPDRTEARNLLQGALQNLDEAAIFTIHGLCQRLLREHSFESGVRFDLELVTDVHPLLSELVHDFWAREVATANDAVVRFMRATGTNVQALLSLGRIAVEWPEVPVIAGASEADPTPTLERFAAERTRAREIWRRSRQEVAELIRSPSLNRNSYKLDQIPDWLLRVDECLQQDQQNLEKWSKDCEKFRSSVLRAATKKGKATPEHQFFVAMESLCAAQAEAYRALEAWVLALKLRLVHFVRQEMGPRKLDFGVQSFDDLLYQMVNALRSESGVELSREIRKRYPAALIDEFQDTDPIQYEIFQRIYGKRATLFLIGDPKQAIYAFRGADIFAYLRAAEEAGSNAHTLVTNYRSDPSLVRALNVIFGRQSLPFLFESIAYQQVSPRPDANDTVESEAGKVPPLQLLFVEREGRTGKNGKWISKRWSDRYLPSMLAAEVSRTLSSNWKIRGRNLLPRDIAILTRTNQEAIEIQKALRLLRIPSALHGDSSVLDSAEASQLARLMRAMAEPNSTVAVRTALATELMGFDAPALARLSEKEAEWEKYIEAFRSFHEQWRRRGFMQAIKALMREWRLSASLLRLVDGERRLTNLRHLIEIIHQGEVSFRLGITGLVQWFDELRLDKTAREGMAPDTQQIRLESDEHAVVLTTMHKSKGLEFEVVFCPYLWRSAKPFKSELPNLRYHDREDNQRLKLDIRNKEAKQDAIAQAETETFAESLRLLYVALTRAKHLLFVVWGAFAGSENSPLGYLLHPEPNIGAFERTASQRIHQFDDAALLQDLAALEQRAEGSIQVRPFSDRPGEEYVPAWQALPVQPERRLGRPIERTRRSSSFTALVAGRTRLSLPQVQGRDLDEHLISVRGTVTESASEIVPLADFPRGAKPGDFLHRVLEVYDFQSDAAALSEIVREQLALSGFEAHWEPVVVDALQYVVRAPLSQSTPELSLFSIPKARRLNELEFTFPVRSSVEEGAAISSAELASVLARHPEPPWEDDYPERIRQLGFTPLRGFLRGFIDLVFEYEGRWYLVDYKSNHLGASFEDYSQARLREVLAEHHYLFQYHVYVVALHRYLQHRIPGYDYDRHFGGVFYLFLRGMDARYGPGQAVFADRPPKLLVTELSRLFERATTQNAELRNPEEST